VPLPRRPPQQQQQRAGGMPQPRPPPAGMNRARYIAQQEAEVRCAVVVFAVCFKCWVWAAVVCSQASGCACRR
jgi:hypothetical protein